MLKKENIMASKTQQTKAIRKRKHAANKENLKKNEKRILENLKALARVAESE